MKRARAGGGYDTTLVVLGKSEIPRGTLKSIISLAGLSDEEFLTLLR
jgi:hypothetical protein